MGRLTIGKVTSILGLFSLDEPEWGVGEMASELKLPKPTVSELLTSLADDGLVRRTGWGRYRLGWRLVELSQTLLETTEFRTEARKVMLELMEQWGETSHLAVLEGIDAVYLEKIQPSPAVKIQLSRTGARLPAHCTGVGKVLLSQANWAEVVAQFKRIGGMPKFTPDTITGFDTFADELEEVRECGFAYDDEENSVGLCCVAAPVRDCSGEVVAAMSLSVPAYRFPANKESYTASIVHGAWRVSEAIQDSGYSFSRESPYKKKGLQGV